MIERPPFRLGQIVVTRGFHALGVNPIPFIKRHQSGDWGDLGEEDKKVNEDALRNGERILSAYTLDPQLYTESRFYIITERDRSLTTVLLCSEY
jgi:hypothetical protein